LCSGLCKAGTISIVDSCMCNVQWLYFNFVQVKWLRVGIKASRPWRKERMLFSPFRRNWLMVNQVLLQPFHPMQLCSLMLSCFLGPVSKIYAKMVAYSRRYWKRERNGRTRRILMKFLVFSPFSALIEYFYYGSFLLFIL
jgi:hypothetical protein